MLSLPLITPNWPVPATVGAAMSTRAGGVSRPPFDSLNLRPSRLEGGAEQGDDPAAVNENLRRHEAALGVRPVFLRQVHGPVVADLDTLDPRSATSPLPVADAAVTTRVGLACTVLVADCLPVLFTDVQGRAVAAAHAGWRGLASGVLEATVESLCRAAGCAPHEVLAWLGPCIGPSAFEVGADVLDAFGVTPGQSGPRFVYAPRNDGSPRWRADLAGLALDRLTMQGVAAVSNSGLCTVGEPSRFFSFRRDGRTGRMAASVWRRT